MLDAYDTDEISETSYINKLRRLAQREPDFIDIHAHLAYAFLEQNTPRKALNAALEGLFSFHTARWSSSAACFPDSLANTSAAIILRL